MILTEDKAVLLPIIPYRDRRPAWANNPAATGSKNQEENITMTEPQSIAQKLQAHASRILNKPSSKVEAALLSKIGKLSDQLLEIEAEARAIGDKKSEIRTMTSTERRALTLPLVCQEEYPPARMTDAELLRAVQILCRLQLEIVDDRRVFLTGQHDGVNTKAAPVRAELLQLRDELQKIQAELSAS